MTSNGEFEAIEKVLERHLQELTDFHIKCRELHPEYNKHIAESRFAGWYNAPKEWNADMCGKSNAFETWKQNELTILLAKQKIELMIAQERLASQPSSRPDWIE